MNLLTSGKVTSGNKKSIGQIPGVGSSRLSMVVLTTSSDTTIGVEVYAGDMMICPIAYISSSTPFQLSFGSDPLVVNPGTELKIKSSGDVSYAIYRP